MKAIKSYGFIRATDEVGTELAFVYSYSEYLKVAKTFLHFT